MKTIILFFLCIIITVIAFGQEPEANVKEIKVTAPKFAGIEKAAAILNMGKSESINEYVAKNFQLSGHQFAEGTEVIQFTVTPAGEVTDFNIINSLSPEIDDKMIKILERTNGMWIPGFNNNVPVEMTKEVTMAFYAGKTSSKSVAEIFTEKATRCFCDGNKMLFEKQNPKKALKYYNWGINYMPNDQSLLLARGICRFETGDKDGARQDWEKLKNLSGVEIENWNLTENAKGLKSYDELTSIFKN